MYRHDTPEEYERLAKAVKEFRISKSASIWSDWCSSGVWDSRGVCIPAEWLPVSNYALALIDAMQLLYDSQDSGAQDSVEIEYADEHGEAYLRMREKAREQVANELPDWNIR